MTPTELLKPRFEVIADYPGCSYEVGEILEPDDSGELHSKTAGYSWTISSVKEKTVGKYPHLFRPLQWWETRDEKDMPEYVRCHTDKSSLLYGHAYKVTEWFDRGDGLACRIKERPDRLYAFSVSHFQPIDADGYKKYKST